MNKRTIFTVIGWGLIGLAVLSFVAHAILQLTTGDEWGYRDHRYQPRTYIGALASFGILLLVSVIGLYYRLKQYFVRRRSGRTQH